MTYFTLSFTSNAGKPRTIKVWPTYNDTYFTGNDGKTYKIDRSGLYAVVKVCYWKSHGAYSGGVTERTIGRYPTLSK